MKQEKSFKEQFDEYMSDNPTIESFRPGTLVRLLPGFAMGGAPGSVGMVLTDPNEGEYGYCNVLWDGKIIAHHWSVLWLLPISSASAK